MQDSTICTTNTESDILPNWVTYRHNDKHFNGLNVPPTGHNLSWRHATKTCSPSKSYMAFAIYTINPVGISFTMLNVAPISYISNIAKILVLEFYTITGYIACLAVVVVIKADGYQQHIYTF